MLMKYFSTCLISSGFFLTLIYLNNALLYNHVMLLISGEYSDVVGSY